jgi:hypothetical protein
MNKTDDSLRQELEKVDLVHTDDELAITTYLSLLIIEFGVDHARVIDFLDRILHWEMREAAIQAHMQLSELFAAKAKITVFTGKKDVIVDFLPNGQIDVDL